METLALIITAGSLSIPVAAHATTTPSTFYVNVVSGTCSDTTANSATTPFCSIQAAVDQATSPGDTVMVTPGTTRGYAPFTVTASGTAAAPITIVSAAGDRYSTSPVAVIVGSSTATPAITVNGASYVNIEGLFFEASQTLAKVTGPASHVTFDANHFEQGGTGTASAVTIGSGTSAITLSRNTFDAFATSPAAIAVTGSSADVITTNIVFGSTGGPDVLLSGTTATDVTSNSLYQSCGSEVSAVAGSTGTSIQNNILSDLASQAIGCSIPDTAASLLKVDASSTTGTIADYNDVSLAPPSNSQMSFYSWAGTLYSSIAAFTAATGQGTHDVNTGGGDAAIDSANSSAPGELSTDLWNNPRVDDPLITDTGAGTAAYYDRGPVETQDPISITRAADWPSQMPIATPGTFAASVTDGWTSVGIANCTFDFGDGSTPVTVAPANGTCTTQHSYAVAGHYRIHLLATAGDGASTPNLSGVSASGTNALQPKVSATALTSRMANIADVGYHAWNILSCVIDFGDGTSTNALAGGCAANHAYASNGTYTITITESDSGGNTASATGSFTAIGFLYNPVAPVRVLDTRAPIGVPSAATVPPGGVLTLHLAGTNAIPGNATAVAMNVTVTNPTAGGNLTVYPDGTPQPTVSNLNFTAGTTVPNLVVATLGDDGSVNFKNSSAGTVNLVADLEGYYASTGEGYAVGASTRVIDTRTTHQTIAPNSTLRVDLGVSPSFTAATLNVTVTNPTAGGNLTVYPDGTAMPTASNLNFTAHQTVANAVVVKIGSNGYLAITNSSAGTVDVIVDSNGYFSQSVGGMAYSPIEPTRFLDTRNGTGDFQTATRLPSGALPGFGIGLLSIAGDAKITAVPAIAVAAELNVTVTRPTTGGYITAYPGGAPNPPLASTLNFSTGQTVANAASTLMHSPGPGGIYLFNGSGGSVQLVVDVFGYYF